MIDSYTYFDIGGSATFDRLGVDFVFMSANYDTTDCAANWRTGFEVEKYNNQDDSGLYPKAKNAMDDQNSIICMQRLENDTYAATTCLYWDIKLK
jgi:hypothetical protein